MKENGGEEGEFDLRMILFNIEMISCSRSKNPDYMYLILRPI